MRQTFKAALLSAALFSAMPVLAESDEMFNILSLDGGGIRGIITGTVVDYMEAQSYRYAREKYCIPERENQ